MTVKKRVRIIQEMRYCIGYLKKCEIVIRYLKVTMYPYNNQNWNGQPNEYNPNGQQGTFMMGGNQGGYSGQGFNNNQGFNNQGYGYGGQGFQSQGTQGFNNQMIGNQGFTGKGFDGPVYPQQDYQYGGGQGGYQPSYNQGFNSNTNQGANNTTFLGFNIPDNFTMTEKLLTIGMDMKLEKNGQQFGMIKQRLFSLGRKFELLNQSNSIIATATEELLTIGRNFKILDNNGALIGTIKEEVWKSMLSFYRKYTIRDRNDVVVGTTKQLQMIKNSVQVLNSMGSVEAKLAESWSGIIRECWDINFYGSNIDRRLLIFFPPISSQRQEEKSRLNAQVHNV